MTDADFGVLLKRMSEIAKVVNSFTSEAVQKEVLSILLASLKGTSVDSLGSNFSKSDRLNTKDDDKAATKVRKQESPATPKSAAGSTEIWTFVRPASNPLQISPPLSSRVQTRTDLRSLSIILNRFWNYLRSP